MYHILLGLALWLCGSASLSAQVPPSLFDVIHDAGDTLRLTLDVDFRRLFKRKTERTYLPAPARLTFAGGTIELEAKARRRGNARLVQCAYPGLKLRFKKNGLQAAGYAPELNDWKIVLPCSDSRLGETYLKREAFGYELYGLLHEHHIRTIPAVLTLGDRTLEVLVLEHPEQLAERYNGFEYPSDKLSSRSMERESYVRLCLFNYLIQNTDFNVFNVHNIAVVARDSALLFTPFPYDFDYSGLVGTNYAVPAEALGIKTIYERVWRGRHVTDEEIAEQATYFASRREDIYELIRTHFKGDRAEQKRVASMVDSYFEEVNNLW